jgi:hypothetical protein
VQSPCAHHVSPRAGKIVNLTFSRCQRLSQGAGARRGTHHVSPRAEQIVNLVLSRCQRLSQGARARRRLFARPAWPSRTLLWHDHQRASRKPVPPFRPSLRHHVSPRAEEIVSLTLSFRLVSDYRRFLARTGDFSNDLIYVQIVRSNGRRGRGVRYSGTIINAHHLSPSLPSRRAFV